MQKKPSGQKSVRPSPKTGLKKADAAQQPVSNFLNSLSRWLAGYETISENQKELVLERLIDASNPDIDFFVLVFLACAIATFGLITNSGEVIIGAMLISPMMSPILSLSIASILGLARLFRQSIIALLEGFGLAIALSSLIAFLTYRLPFGALASITDEVLARSSPSLIDLLIALAGGAAAAYALAHPQLSAALPGVAISIALMPPICTIGVGIALAQSAIILGALLLFITNLTAISFAAMLTFAVMGFKPKRASQNGRVTQSVSISLVLVLALSIPLGIFAYNTINEARIFSQARNAIVEGVSEFTDAALVDLNISNEGEVKKLDAVLRTSRNLSHNEVLAVQSAIADRLQKPVALELVAIPMQMLDPLRPPTPTPTITPTPYFSATPTITATPSPVPSATPSPTATPSPAFIKPSRGAGIFDQPNGELLFRLPQNAAVWVNIRSAVVVNKVTWIEIRDTFGRLGWIVLPDLDIQIEESLLP